MVDLLVWIATEIFAGFANLFWALTNPGQWLGWIVEFDANALIRFIYYGGSSEFFFGILNVVLMLTVAGLVFRRGLWWLVIGSEFVQNTIGRVFAYAGLVLVLQQVLIVFLQRIFRINQIPFSPFGLDILNYELSWYSEELKLYNAMIVCLCTAYTFVQGGHVRVDLFYAGMRHRTKRLVDMLGSLVLMLPMTVMIWLFSWFFMWRHLVVPNPSASADLERLERGARALRWNVETIGFSPNGFNAYWMFKVLMVILAGLLFLSAVTFFWRSLLEFLEGEDAKDKHLDRDTLGDETAELAADIH